MSKHLLSCMMATAIFTLNSCSEEDCEAVGTWETASSVTSPNQVRLELNVDGTGELLMRGVPENCFNDSVDWAIIHDLTFEQNGNNVILVSHGIIQCGDSLSYNNQFETEINCESNYLTLNGSVLYRQ